MVEFVFTNNAKNQYEGLPRDIQERVLKKLLSLKKHPDIFTVLIRLHAFEPATHRLRIGSFRIILQFLEKKNGGFSFRVLALGHRRDVYR